MRANEMMPLEQVVKPDDWVRFVIHARHVPSMWLAPCSRQMAMDIIAKWVKGESLGPIASFMDNHFAVEMAEVTGMYIAEIQETSQEALLKVQTRFVENLEKQAGAGDEWKAE